MNLTRTTMFILGGLSLLIAVTAALMLRVGFVTSFVLYGLATMVGLSMLIAAVYPCVVVYFKEQCSSELVVLAKRHAVMSLFTMFVAICGAIGISLISHLLNVLVGMFAVACALFVALFSFNLNLRIFSIPIVGPLSVIGWILVTLVLLVTRIDHTSHTREIGDNLTCRTSDWGFVGTAQGFTSEVYRRYVVIDVLVASQTRLYDDIEQPSVLPPDKAETLNRCMTPRG